MRVALCLLAVVLIALCAAAHEVRPAYLEITETEAGQYDVIWKQPVLDGRRLKLEPMFPGECARRNERMSAPAATLITRWSMICDL
ncbi:MAG: HupE/UreJ family protein, partial [Hyphomonas sp.]